jgi:hypothetical protein
MQFDISRTRLFKSNCILLEKQETVNVMKRMIRIKEARIESFQEIS